MAKLYSGLKDFIADVFSADIAAGLKDEYEFLPPRIYSSLESTASVRIYDGTNDEVLSEAEFLIFAGGMESIADNAFAGNDTLRFIVLPDSIKNIGSSAFESCKNLVGAVLPRRIDSIGDRCFYNCEKLEFVYDFRSATGYIGEKAFANCIALQDLERIRARELGASVFEGCSSLKACLWNSKTVPARAFKNCTALEDFYLGATCVHDEAFDGCISLREYKETIHVDGVDQNGARAGGEIVNTRFLPLNLTHIGKRAFRDCRSLRHIELPYRIEHIEDGAFEGCIGLREVVVPYRYFVGTPEFGDNIFSGCCNLPADFDIRNLL